MAVFLENLAIDFFFNLIYNETLFYLLYSYTTSIFGWKSGTWDMGRNALGQLDYTIFKSTIHLEQCYKNSEFFACWYKFIKVRSWMKNIWRGLDQKKVFPLWHHRTLKLAVSQ